jgi:ATP-dependent Clp protease ATP-binding subunit ClpA
MRLDKLTTKFQEALADAQSLAVNNDNPYIEPVHVLAAMLAQADGPKALLARAGVNTAKLQTDLDTAIKKLPQVQGGEQVQASRGVATPRRCCRPPRRKPPSAATSSSRARCSSSPRPTASPRSAPSSRNTA